MNISRNPEEKANSKSSTIADDVASVWQVAYLRINAWRRSRAVRQETIWIVGLMVLVNFVPFLSWWKRWTLTNSPQSFAVFVLPLTVVWLWLNRFRLALPELDSLLKRYQQSRSSNRQMRSEIGDRDERDLLAVSLLLKEKPPPAKRLNLLLGVGLFLTVVGGWISDPTLTAVAFLLQIAGVIGYRHGSHAVRVAAFPLLFMLFMVPIPGPFLDKMHEWMDQRLFSVALHILLNCGVSAELPLEADPIRILSAQPYQVWSAQIGMGIPEAGFFLMLTIWFLSLVRAPIRLKVLATVVAFIWVTALMVIRITLLCYIGIEDKDMIVYLAPFTLLFLPVIAVVGQLVILRGIHCQKYQRWVSI